MFTLINPNGANSIQDLGANPGTPAAITNPDEQFTTRFNLVTGLFELVNTLGVVVGSFSVPNNARGGASKIQLFPNITAALLTGIVGPTATFAFAGIFPADFFAQWSAALIGAIPMTNPTPALFANISIGIDSYGAPLFGGFINGKGLSLPNAILETGNNYAGGQLKNLVPVTGYVKIDFVDGTGGSIPNAGIWAGDEIKIISAGRSFGNAASIFA